MLYCMPFDSHWHLQKHTHNPFYLNLESYIMQTSKQYMAANKLLLQLWLLIRPGSQYKPQPES